MVSLLDIAAPKKIVPVLGETIEVRGLSARDIAHLLAKFPELRLLLVGKQLDFEDILRTAPDAIAAIIACGSGNRGDRNAEAVADALPVEVQADLVEAVIGMTLPHGFSPFAERVLAWIDGAGAAAPTKDQATNSPSQSNS